MARARGYCAAICADPANMGLDQARMASDKPLGGKPFIGSGVLRQYRLYSSLFFSPFFLA